MNVLARVGVDFGGGALARIQQPDGDVASISAGELATFSLGFIYQPAASFAVEMTVGYKVTSVDLVGGSLEFIRYPIDLVVSATLGKNRFGVGATYHVGPSFRCHARPICDGVIDLDDALGVLLQVAHTIPFRGDGGFDFGARLTWGLTYGASDAPPASDSFDGNSFGIFAGLRL